MSYDYVRVTSPKSMVQGQIFRVLKVNKTTLHIEPGVIQKDWCIPLTPHPITCEDVHNYLSTFGAVSHHAWQERYRWRVRHGSAFTVSLGWAPDKLWHVGVVEAANQRYHSQGHETMQQAMIWAVRTWRWYIQICDPCPGFYPEPLEPE